jgi:hypothetical protein
MEAGHKLAIGVRCTPITESDPWSVMDRVKMISAVYPDAYVFPVPDIESVNVGRKVGYEVNRYEVPNNIAGISATQIRKDMKQGSDAWTRNVPQEVVTFLGNKNMGGFAGGVG